MNERGKSVYPSIFKAKKLCSSLSLWAEWEAQCADKDTISYVEAALTGFFFFQICFSPSQLYKLSSMEQ